VIIPTSQTNTELDPKKNIDKLSIGQSTS